MSLLYIESICRAKTKPLRGILLPFMCFGIQKEYVNALNLRVHLKAAHETIEDEPAMNMNIPEQEIENSSRIHEPKHIPVYRTTRSLPNLFGIKSASLCLKTNNSCSSVNISISKDDQHTLSSFSGVPVTLGLEVGEEATKEVVESLTLLSEDYLDHFLEGSKYPGLLGQQGYE
ncbi:hypothetical protein BCV71DRAFT_276850 [Rhizopus microsporus]|uniref:Uncharacterized protein n=1 Tax=Rhizopus microsporus TaxID=58291 RepID=A0A1X0RPW1_RHIZD|nr:hypothetical protein BCV71DRAFT_276850 [Rhizopus microsporus]